MSKYDKRTAAGQQLNHYNAILLERLVAQLSDTERRAYDALTSDTERYAYIERAMA